MKTDDHLNDKNQPVNGRLALMVFSIGAIIGVLISMVLSRTNRIKAFFRQTPPYSEPSLDGEPSSTKIVDQVTDLSTNQISLAPGNPSTISPVQMPTASSAVPTAGLTSKISLPVVKTAAAVASPASNRWSAPTRYMMGVFLFLSVIVVLFIGRSVIPMVIGAALLALLVDPLIRFMMRRMRMKKGLAVGLTYFLVVAIVVLIPLLAVPSLVQAFNFVTQIDTQLVARQLSEVIQSISSTLQASPGLSALLQPTLDSLSIRLESFASESQVGVSGLNLSVADLTSGFGKAMGTVADILGPTFSVLVSLLFTLLMSLQMSLTADAFTNWYADLIPTDYSPELNGLLTNIRQTWTGFLRGQMMLMLFIGIVIWLGATILGLPQAILLGVIAGVMELIPNVGPTLAAIPAVLLALLFGSANFEINHLVFAFIVVAFYVLVQLMENQLIVPKIMGEAVNLPTLVVLIGTIAGAGAFGILGALLATPAIATGNLVFRYIYGKIMEKPPLPPPVEEKPGILARMKGFLAGLQNQFKREKRSSSGELKGQ
jgi:predicted PurR-regulated permease PerM